MTQAWQSRIIDSDRNNVYMKPNKAGEVPITYQEVLRKARYGHRDWIFWRDRSGYVQAERKSIDAVKRCLLDVGTKGNWSLICADGTPMKGFWWLGLNLLRQMRLGMY